MASKRIRGQVRRGRLGDVTLGSAALLLGWGGPGGCPPLPDPGVPRYVNTSDPTNNQANYVGSGACSACHGVIAGEHARHGHSAMLTQVQGTAPESERGLDVPFAPPGSDWSGVSYVIGGFTRQAYFLDREGYFVMATEDGAALQWNVGFAANGTARGFAAGIRAFAGSRAYEESCYGCHTTGPLMFNAAAPRFEAGRPGIPGGWREPGVQCEACHGPGGSHFFTRGNTPAIDRGRIYIDPTGDRTCAACHNGPYGDISAKINAADGYIAEYEQWSELRASGGHARFACTVCHDPHRSLKSERPGAIRNECRACHRPDEVTMAGHGGKVYRQGRYIEPLTCESCHMPFAGRSGSQAGPEVVGPRGRMGDVRTHIFRINTEPVSAAEFFSPDGLEVRRDELGRAAVTVDFVCLRCHHGLGNVFALSLERAAEIAGQIHDLP